MDVFSRIPLISLIECYSCKPDVLNNETINLHPLTTIDFFDFTKSDCYNERSYEKSYFSNTNGNLNEKDNDGFISSVFPKTETANVVYHTDYGCKKVEYEYYKEDNKEGTYYTDIFNVLVKTRIYSMLMDI